MSYLEHFNTNLEHLLQSLNEYYTHSDYNTPLEGDIYLKQFLNNCINKGYDISTKNEIIFSEDSVILNGVDFNRLWNDNNIEDEQKENIWKYLHTLYIYAIQYKTNKNVKLLLEEFNGVDLTTLNEESTTFMNIIEGFKNNIEMDSNVDNVDLGDLDKNMENSKDIPFNMPDLFGGTIGELAKEIADDIDPSTLQLDDPTALLQNLMSGNLENDTSGIKDLISNITGKIQTKLSSGELDQDALFKEATNMMGQFGSASNTGQDPFAGMFGAMNNGSSNSNVNMDTLFANMSASMGNMSNENVNTTYLTKQLQQDLSKHDPNRLKLEQQREHLRQKLKEKKDLLEVELKNTETPSKKKKKRKRKKNVQDNNKC